MWLYSQQHSGEGFAIAPKNKMKPRDEFFGGTGRMGAYSVVLSLDDLVIFCGLGRHLQLARSACFQLLDLTHANAGKSEKRESIGVCLGLRWYGRANLLTCSPWLGQICGWTWCRAPPCALRRGSPCPGRSPSAGWIAPWRSRQGQDLPGIPRTPEPRMTPQSPGSSPGSRAMKRGHRWRQKEAIKTMKVQSSKCNINTANAEGLKVSVGIVRPYTSCWSCNIAGRDTWRLSCTCVHISPGDAVLLVSRDAKVARPLTSCQDKLCPCVKCLLSSFVCCL